MRALVAYVMGGRTQAVTASSVCAALSLVVPPLSYVSGAVIGLAALRNGVAEGALIVAGSVVLAGLFTFLLLDTLYPVLVFALFTWIPMWVLGNVLRYTSSQGATLAAAGVLGAVAVVGMHVLVADPGEWWRRVFDEIVVRATQDRDVSLDSATLDSISGLLDRIAPMMTGVVAAGTVFGLMVTLLLARWSQALLDNPGGFGREFRELRLGRGVAAAAVVVAVAALLFNAQTGGFAAEFLWLAVTMYLFQGLAAAHCVVYHRRASVIWLVVLYTLLLIMPPHMVFMVAIMGFSDTWLDYRARCQRGA